MGNCQAVDAAALVIQHPCGKLERMYWPIAATEVMKANPGHYVSLIIPLPLSDGSAAAGGGGQENSDDSRTIRFTRVKLLRPTDTLVLGRAYRLVTTQEVMKVLRAKKHAKAKKNISESGHDLQMSSQKQGTSAAESGKNDQGKRSERNQQRSNSTNLAAGRSKSWRPSLQSISEAENRA